MHALYATASQPLPVVRREGWRPNPQRFRGNRTIAYVATGGIGPRRFREDEGGWVFYWETMIDAEYEKVVPIANRWGVDPAFIMAIRKAENGGPGREFGVLSRAAATWELQCHWTCVTVRNRLYATGGVAKVHDLHILPDGSRRLRYSRDFLQRMAERWAPVGAANDPHGLNLNWVKNVDYWYQRYMDQTIVGLPFHA